MNKSESIRAYIAANPGTSPRQIGHGTGIDAHFVSNTCRKMSQRGLLIASRIEAADSKHGRPEFTYTVGRTKLITREERGPLSHANRAPKAGLRAFLTDLVRKDAPVAYTGPTESSDEAIARGVRVEVIPAKWQQPTRYPMYAGGFV